MCGRFTLAVDAQVITERFKVILTDLNWKPRYNIAPTQPCPVVTSDNHQRRFLTMCWGLIPHWSKDKKTSYRMINARVETINSKPAFCNLFRTKRCLIPADGFYEWKQTPKGKIPFRAALKDDALFGFAGLWDVWKNDKEEEIKSFTILTTVANSLLNQLHDRMPVILKKKDEERWLDLNVQDPNLLEPLLTPYSAQEMKLFEVSSIVNSWKNDVAECILPTD